MQTTDDKGILGSRRHTKSPLTLPKNQINVHAWVTVYQELSLWSEHCSVNATQKQCSNVLAFLSLAVEVFTLVCFLLYFIIS